MTEKQLELIIDKAIDCFCRLLKIEIGWNFGKSFNPENDKRVMASYIPNEDIILINPDIFKLEMKYANQNKNVALALLYSVIGHEMRHKWQTVQPQFKNGFKGFKTLANGEEEYLDQAIELDAYAFQQMILQTLVRGLKFQFPFNQELIQEKANELEKHYKKNLIKILKIEGEN
jgi:hypothetical protein